MEFRDLGEKRSVQRPSVDLEDLERWDGALKGEIDVVDVRVSGGDHKELRGEGEIRRSLLDGVDFSESRLGPLTLADVVLHNMQLNNAQWRDLTVRRVELTSCRAIGWSVSFELVADLYIADCRLDYARLNIERVKGLAVFERCTFRQATIGGNLANVVFLDCEFRDAEFNANAALGCDLRSSRLAGARGLSSLRGARVTGDQVVSIAERLAVEAGLRIES